ncbi:MAG: ComF family protein [Planctomycetota bacterium]
MRQLVHAFKYGGRRDLLAPLGRALADVPRAAALWDGSASPLLVPVPARPRSRKQRGFDQAEELAVALAGRLGLPCETRALLRRRDSGPQAGRSRRQRRWQAAVAFRASPLRVSGRSILLVDDVLSTGATADSAARVLRRAGALRISVLTLAT